MDEAAGCGILDVEAADNESGGLLCVVAVVVDDVFGVFESKLFAQKN